MLYELSNDNISVKIDSMGAELKSLMDEITHMEYMWEGNPEYWKRTAPVLFPLVGSLKNGKYTYEGREYHMSQHGFARDMEFEASVIEKDQAVFTLLYNEETLQKYPFKFRLDIEYRLDGRSLWTGWTVSNYGDRKMYFSIGGHPAYNCPPDRAGKRNQYFLKFDTDSIVSRPIVSDGLVGSKTEKYTFNNGLLNISDDLFDRDALIIEGNQSHKVSLADAYGKEYLTVKFDAPLFGIWSPVKAETAPFVCIEPWYGRCDSEDFEGDISDREWENVLLPGDKFHAGYTVCV